MKQENNSEGFEHLEESRKIFELQIYIFYARIFLL